MPRLTAKKIAVKAKKSAARKAAKKPGGGAGVKTAAKARAR